MRKFHVLGVSLALMILASCDSSGGAGYGFQNQNLQGKIDGVSWTYVSGTAEVLFGDELWFDLYNVNYTGASPFLFGAYPSGVDKILFTISPVSVGLHELGFGPGLETVTLFEAAGSSNWICSEGAVEILSIGGGVVTGRIDARFDSSTFVNGNFTAAYQP